ncbi:MAG: alanine dehydrogenase [Desulfobacterium sp.]|nr:alanine dehydrogenase [Desulfobacterium sp.]
MKIGVPKEIKVKENRVSLTPAGVAALVECGHSVYVEKGAGDGSGIIDQEYVRTGARILHTPDAVWAEADLIIKVKEPLEPEFGLMKEGQILFTFLHLAADQKLTQVLLDRKVIGVAYETIQLENGSLPLLAPMSAVAGRLSVQMGCACLEAKNGGKGLLVSGVPGVAPARVTIVGGGISGINAAQVAIGMGARVTILDINQERLRYLDHLFYSQAVTLMSNPVNLERSILNADLVIGAVLIPGAKAPKLIKKDYLKGMEPGSALVDIAIDQGGCAETSKPTTHDDPMYIVDNIVHYCVANMPGAVPRTSTYALTNATLSYVLELANKGLKKALKENSALEQGLNVYKGQLTCEEVANAFGMKHSPVSF